MRNIYRYLIQVNLYLLAICHANAQADTVLNRYRNYLLGTPSLLTDVGQIASSLNANHQWPDLNYRDTARAFWQNLDHLKRVRDMAFAWATVISPYYNNDGVRNAIHFGLEHWLSHRYKNSNWWHNEIGVPQYMRDIIVLFRKELSASELDGALQVLHQYRLQESGAGANLIWSADLALHYAALTGDEELMKKASQLIIVELHVSTGEGIQPDFSYHQHGARLQEYHYGSAFLKSNIRIAWQLRGTRWAFPQEKIQLLADFILNGWQWMSRGIYTVPGTIDRAVSRRNYLASADIRESLPMLFDLYPGKSFEFDNILLRQEGLGESLRGFRYYPYSDFSVYQQKDFSFFLKTISSRTLPSESINSENLKGNLLNSGDGYLIKNGREYFNLMPAWDWDALPGITSFKGAKKIIRKEFVGSVTDSTSGLTSIDYGLESVNGAMNLKKSWFCHDGLVVCLITVINASEKGDNIFSVLDQCRWQGDVLINNQSEALQEGHHSLKNLRWISHNGLAYVLTEPMDVELDLREVSGSWKSINTSETDSLIKEKVFLPVIPQHGKTNFGYVLTTAQSVKEIKAIVEKPRWKEIHNNKNYQAVTFQDGTTMIAFYSASAIHLGKHVLSVDHPCLLMIKGNKLFVSNPLHTPVTLHGKWDKFSFKALLPENGYTVSSKVRNLD